ncbi:MAG: helix-turn-helix domain-containing protein [Candidatus Binatia bacterium]
MTDVVVISPEELEKLINRAIIEALALAKKEPAQLLFKTAEAARMLGVKTSWLGAKARAGEVPFRRLGHNVRFHLSDVEAIAANPPAAPERKRKPGRKSKRPVDSACTSGINYTHDRQTVQTDTKSSGDESI